ncbi:MAG: HD domain-containing protein [Arcobacteraceae bacterium]|nr:HD domain-containing protein [Arcobacteraceae bacterium]
MIEDSTYSIKKIKLLRLVIILSLAYSFGLAVVDYFHITPKIEYRVEVMSFYAICNTILLLWISKASHFNKAILYAVLFLALIVFSITMVIYPFSEIRVMWYFFTIMIAYYVGGRKVGHTTAIASLVIIYWLAFEYGLDFSATANASIIIGILFVSQLSNYFVTILDENEKELYNYQHHLQDMVDNAVKVIEELNIEITDTQKEVVFTMGAIGESRSKETGNHVKRVAEYSKILALAYGVKEEEAELLKMASPMHDIGKVGIPDSILKKPARLTVEEFEIMKGHAELGYEMLKYSKREILQTAAIVANQHHERWDGKGYPKGLSGEGIHLYGRITAIADVFDALGSERVYKPSWSDDEIFALFKEERGKQFDPKLVDLFFENFSKLDEVRKHFADV